MGIELRRGGGPIQWLSYSINLCVRFRKVVEDTTTYLRFKRMRGQFPLFTFAMFPFLAALVAIPRAALAYGVSVPA